FPAALLDEIAVYNYLVNRIGFDPSGSTTPGYPAGYLALALIRYMRHRRHQYHLNLRLPWLLASPLLLLQWADLGPSYDGLNISLANCTSRGYADACAVEHFLYTERHPWPLSFGFVERRVYALTPPKSWVGAQLEGFL
ncbi:hypothetical protein EDD15DRAFT_2158625, partial [Pisolithus albus]